jgi:glycosyltransferase involved in cell wall biosynthesis
MASGPSLTVLIPTFNRASILRDSLVSLTQVDRLGIDCLFIVIDNNSSDGSSEIARQFQHKLPLQVVSEPTPGKNAALNKALRECRLNDIVVFTDDDISPSPDWLRQIIACSMRHPGITVFGGQIDILWPEKQSPVWAQPDWIQSFGYGRHHYAEKEALYTPPHCPFGGNYWIRSTVLRLLPSFDETIGPNPHARIMGSETSFLRTLQKKGVPMLYCPTAAVQHRVQKKDCTIAALRRRGFTFGRGMVRLNGLHRVQWYSRSRLLWRVVIMAEYSYAYLCYVRGVLYIDAKSNCHTTVKAMIRLGSLHESRLATQKGIAHST